MSVLVRIVNLSVVLSLLLIHNGAYVLHAEGLAGDADVESTVYLPMMGSRACYQKVSPNLFGVQMYGRTDDTSPYFRELYQSGATWVRVPVAWHLVEPVNSDVADFKWRSADSALAAAQDACLNVIVTHRWNPKWAAKEGDGQVYWSNLDDLAEYMAALVERYDGDGKQDAPGSPVVRYWELYNEPDSTVPSTGWGRDPERYAAMLKVVYPAIKKASPKAKVLIGGLAYDSFVDQGGVFNRSFLEKVVAAGGGKKFDMMNFHYFPVFASNWSVRGPGLLQKTRAVRREMERLGLNQPIVITESGHYVNSEPPLFSSPELQMRFLVELYTQAKAADIKVLVWFTLNDLVNYPHKMGLVTDHDPPRKRPAFYAYQFAAQELSAAKFRRKLTSSETSSVEMEVYQFRDKARQRTIYVAWMNPAHNNTHKSLSLAGSQAVVRDVFGDSTLIKDGEDGVADGRVTVTVGGRPVYIEIE